MRFALVLALVMTAGIAEAHDLRPGVLSLTEVGEGDYAFRFVPPIDSRGDAAEVTVELPAGCAPSGNRVRCTLAGDIGVAGMTGAMKTVVVVTRGGQRQEWILDAANPRVSIDAAPPSAWRAWIGLGITHILAGFDHLAFVLGLLLVLNMRVDRRLLVTITAFTIAHSLTLALAVLEVVRVSVAPVEACIALSVVLIAREALHDDETLIRRQPWIVAGIFGLVHGLGFASALREVGLGSTNLARSLVAFNVGVEAGQLAVVAAALAVVAVGRRLIGERRIVGLRIHDAACYALGAIAAAWLIQRVVELLRGAG